MKNFAKTMLLSAAMMAAGITAQAMSFSSADPASGSTLTTLKSVSLTFQDIQAGYNLEYDQTNGYILYSYNGGDLQSIGLNTLEPSISGASVITLTLPTPLTQDGAYTIYVPTSAIYSVNSTDDAETADPEAAGTIESGDYEGTSYSAMVEYIIEQPAEPLVVTKSAQDLTNLAKGSAVGSAAEGWGLTFDVTNNLSEDIVNLTCALYLKYPFDSYFRKINDNSVAVQVSPGGSKEMRYTAFTTPNCPGTYEAKFVVSAYQFKTSSSSTTLTEPIELLFPMTINDEGADRSYPVNGTKIAGIDHISYTYPAKVIYKKDGTTVVDSMVYTHLELNKLAWKTDSVKVSSSGKKTKVAATPVVFSKYPDTDANSAIAITQYGVFTEAEYSIDGLTMTLNLPTPLVEDGFYYCKIPQKLCWYLKDDGTRGKTTFTGTTDAYTPTSFIYFYVDHLLGVTDVSVVEEGNAVYYDLQGRMVTNPQHGIYIQRIGNKARKVLL